MTHQTTMFNQVTDAYGNVNVVSTPIARKADPETSHIAASRVPLTERQQEFVDGIRALGKATAREAAKIKGRNEAHRDSIRKRAAECVRLGYVKVAGRRDCIETNNPATVYELIK